ncbi:hypothetical protein MMIC_P1490 [Mariprofundus micogutta]|uniref:DUF3617 family protein n=1 Tax=Mariprofundus micogutta TaxID=1921010 RepID=A0A1L8CNM3_9PROT|nr:DUF3617 family protein [Mariprofundus micogutta]GAV20522.1 hypothetical protein MMIC_P1490 [Mariprofundus micogutta]
MQRHHITLLALLILCTGTSCSSDAPARILEEGEWEMTTQMEMSGMPAGMPAMPPMTHRQCLSNDMMVPAQTDKHQNCEKIEQLVSGNTVTWSMRCTANGMISEMSGTTTYSGDTMEGSMHMNSQGMTMESHITGKRLGPCK